MRNKLAVRVLQVIVSGAHIYVFLFRMLAGIYFALLFRLRGFGIAVGTHAFYDIIVGVTLTTG